MFKLGKKKKGKGRKGRDNEDDSGSDEGEEGVQAQEEGGEDDGDESEGKNCMSFRPFSSPVHGRTFFRSRSIRPANPRR